jgi:hypothetical protein
MDKTILIAGKDFPDGKDLASSAILHGDAAVITASPLTPELNTEDGSVPVIWNRASALSARSLVLSSLNQNGHLDEAVLIFDEQYFAPKYGSAGAAESNRAFDELILGYHYLTAELLLRFGQRKLAGLESKPGKIAFIYKSNLRDVDAVKKPDLRASNSNFSKALVAAAGDAFKAFAENFAASVSATDDVIPVLVECDSENETAKRDGSLMTWLCDYMDQIDILKKDLTPKQKVSWIKAGTKSPGGFALFK